ncbi:nucleoside deaminase [Acidiphilium sp. PA]|uniref:nucleoside deaminase n=1 Tax=Acidiphilium sp. PA TaxID=2871705 RepID=UPI0022431F3A|nr:nucleoside deaminase [Acidiphilium sp. PA]MCW8306231.1 nucleoside deaminase [Acidiphilium sp. PA]
MAQALIEAGKAAARGEVPVGAVVTDAAGTILAAFGNEVEARQDTTAHAELLALRAAALRLGGKFLPGCTLTVTLEPCPLCAAAASLFRIERLVFGAYDPKSGGVEHGPRIFEQATCHHRPAVVGGVAERESAAMLTNFFKTRRDPANSAER